MSLATIRARIRRLMGQPGDTRPVAVPEQEDKSTLPEFFARARPDLDHPDHLWAPGVDAKGNPARSLGEALSETVHSPQQASFSTPPQFGKSVLVLIALVWFALRKPGSVSAYVSYNDEIVREQSERAWTIGRNVGMDPSGTKARISFANGSVIHFASIRGTLEGKAITGIAVLDDPYKNSEDAGSPIVRGFVQAWFLSTFLSRTHPTTSVFIIGHRWTADDLIAVMDRNEVEGARIPWTNYPALWPDGRSLWERFKSAAWLAAKRALVGPNTWEGEYQGNPAARGGKLFPGVTRWSYDGRAGTLKLPERHLLKNAVGVDLAYSERTSSDWSVAIVIAEYNAKWYVLEVHREQCTADVWAARLKLIQSRYPGAHMRWHGSTTERGAAQAMRALGKINLQGVLATGHAYDRAQLVGAAWRRGDVAVPIASDSPDAVATETFVNILNDYSGGEGAQDDDVAALASGFEQLPARLIENVPQPGSPEWIVRERERTRARLAQEILAQQRMSARGRR